MKELTIGKLAKLTEHTVVTLRYYEKNGLLPQSRRSENGYRLYPKSIINRLYFIKNAKSVGFSLREIKMLLDLNDKKLSSKDVKLTIQEKIAEITHKIFALEKIKNSLQQLDKVCDGKISIEQCPIMENLFQKPEMLLENSDNASK